MTEVQSDDVPTLIAAYVHQPSAAVGAVELASTPTLDAFWRGLILRDQAAAHLPPIDVAVQDEVLATTEGRPIWVRRRDAVTSYTSAMPTELAAGETLRDRFRPGRFVELLPLLTLLRAATAGSAWSPPSLRGALVFDDPNLHRNSYGYLHFEELARAAATHDYHVAFAMVPLDGWHASSHAVDLFREENAALSLLMHGNNHLRSELARPLRQERRRALLAQALRRVARFERRYGVPVSRVMAPPHGRCSREMAEDMVAFGFEGLCISNPRPWQSANSAADPLLGWGIAELSDDGLPIIPRYHLKGSRDELLFRAFLGQPIILYGHHTDVSGGLDFLTEAAADINRLGEVQWLSLTRIARSNFATRRQGRRLDVRLYSRQVEIDVPEGVEELVIHSELARTTADERLNFEGPGGAVVLPLVQVASQGVPLMGPGRVIVRLVPSDAPDPSGARAPRWNAWPLTRRLLSEARDRTRPFADSLVGSARRQTSTPATARSRTEGESEVRGR